MAAAADRPSFGLKRRAAPTIRWLFAFVAVTPFGAIAAALVSQYAYGMQPCPWCVLERLIFVAIGVFALLGLVWRGTAGSRVAATCASVLALAGFTAAMWQHFVAARSESCAQTLADRIMTSSQLDQLVPSVFEARVSCADAAVNILGIPYPFLAAMLFALCAIAMVRALRLA